MNFNIKSSFNSPHSEEYFRAFMAASSSLVQMLRLEQTRLAHPLDEFCLWIEPGPGLDAQNFGDLKVGIVHEVSRDRFEFVAQIRIGFKYQDNPGRVEKFFVNGYERTPTELINSITRHIHLPVMA